MTIPQAFEFALQHHQAGRLAEAEALYRQILAAQPNHADALHLLGVIAHQSGRQDLAVEWIRKAIALNPNHPAAHCNLGETYRTIGRLDEAIAAFREALRLKPDFLEACNNLGVALRERGRFDEAMAEFHRAIELKPDYPEAHSNLGNTHWERGQLDEAVASHRRAIEIEPGYAAAHNNLGVVLKDLGRPEEAVAAYRRALELKPDFPEAHGNLIFAMHFHPGHDRRTIAGEQRRWNRQFSDPLKGFFQPHANDRNPERRLRVGYVSADFRDHPVGRFVLPLFERQDRERFEILCYSGTVRTDWLTERFRALAGGWRSTLGVSDARLAEMIREDGVDILVDLALHTSGNRLLTFARKPAPLLVSFGGYPGSAGVDAIEHRISDRFLEGDSPQASITGEDVRLVESYWCYDPCGVEWEVSGLPAKERGNVTFGSLNSFCKVNEQTLRLWARVIGKVKSSRLILLSRAGNSRKRTLEVFEREGVGADRLEFLEFLPQKEYFELYHRLDIVLDTFPYNGHTTSLDALWMGAPVVSLAGNTPVSRAGLSQLSNLGLPELAAHSETEFVSIAESLARDLPRLAQLRSSLRERMKNSPLMDAPRYARQMEQAYREMWRTWCAGESPSAT
jgi:protein O-GlcNAc transferase